MAVVLVLFFLCVIGLLAISWNVIYWKQRKSMKLPPLAEGALPIIGHAGIVFAGNKKLYNGIVNETLGASIKKGHDIVTILSGTVEAYVVLNPDDGFIVANSCLTKDVFYKFFKPLAADKGMITADEQVWKRHRKLLNPTFNQSVLDTYLIEFNDQSRQLVKQLAQEVGRGYFNPLPYFKYMMLKLVCATIMGASVEEEDIIQKAGEAFEVVTECVVDRLKKFWLYYDFMFNLSFLKRKQYAAAKIFLELTHEILRKKKADLTAQEGKATDESANTRYKSFLDLVLELSKDGSLTESEIVEEVNTFIAAAFDTTYHTVGMTLLTIGSHPEVQRKVLEELHGVFEESDRDVERQDISKLKYMEAVLKETMRLYPTVIAVGRTLDKDLNLQNYILPSGSRCYVSIHHVNRHSTWGADAEVFRPERWLDNSLPANVNKVYAAFGLGRRSCIGSTYALMSMKTALAHVLRRYRVSGDVTQLALGIDVVMTPLSGHHIKIEPRQETKAVNGRH